LNLNSTLHSTRKKNTTPEERESMYYLLQIG
jgi:hypothetical protein